MTDHAALVFCIFDRSEARHRTLAQRQQKNLRSSPAFHRPCTTARHNLATSFTRALSEPNPIATHPQTPACARGLASKRALHPIHNVKQPKNKRRLTPPYSFSIFFLSRRDQETGGAERDRTDDLLLAKQALSQLSYGPINEPELRIGPELALAKLVGQGRFELPTSRLSSARSNQLSY